MSRTVLIAGGGTGGHLFPGVAVAQALMAMSPGLEAAFVSAGRALESRLLAEAGLPLEALDVTPFRGGGLTARARALGRVPGAVARAMGIISRRKPALVLAVGGYAALPLGLAAALKGVPLVVQEQNAAPGLTNRALSRFARVVFTAWPGLEAHLPPHKVRLVGNPVRAELLAQAADAAQGRPDAHSRFHVAVLGGSQGAASLNAAVTGALEQLAWRRDRLVFTHQAGEGKDEPVRRAYAAAGFAADVAPFFGEVGRVYGRAHLVFCRAGAGTLSEVAACGRACVAVPYPHAAGDHQTLNARVLEAAGAARLVADTDLTPAVAAKVIAQLMDDEPARQAMERAALSLAQPDAAREIARQCLEIMEGRRPAPARPGQAAGGHDGARAMPIELVSVNGRKRF